MRNFFRVAAIILIGAIGVSLYELGGGEIVPAPPAEQKRVVAISKSPPARMRSARIIDRSKPMPARPAGLSRMIEAKGGSDFPVLIPHALARDEAMVKRNNVRLRLTDDGYTSVLTQALNEPQEKVLTSQKEDAATGLTGSNDYERIGHAIAYLEAEYQDQPGLEDLSQELGLSPAHLQRLFKRWAGVSPKGFLQAVTHSHARKLLENHTSVLDASYEVGLSGPGRLHDLFVKVEAMTPGEVKTMGAGLLMRWGLHATPFGEGLYVMSPRGFSGLAFTEGTDTSRTEALADMQSRWPLATFEEDPGASKALAARLYGDSPGEITVALSGTPFQLQVWQALLAIPEGQAVTYSDIAAHVGKPKAMRAVGTAVGRNPISWLIPCHRVLRTSGALGGYHWGVTRKRAMMAWESANAGLLSAD